MRESDQMWSDNKDSVLIMQPLRMQNRKKKTTKFALNWDMWENKRKISASYHQKAK